MSRGQIIKQLAEQIVITRKVLRALEIAKYHLRNPANGAVAWSSAVQNIKVGEWHLHSSTVDGKLALELTLNPEVPDFARQIYLMRCIAGDLVIEHPHTPAHAVWLHAH